jgi:glycosyltransferase involved in cell wall biosynthesis
MGQMVRENRRVSAIIPAFNCENSIERCVQSALRQTVSPKEVFVINDGSTDRTSDLLRGMDDKVTVIEQENKGQGAARNAGLRVSTGKYVAFLDADDYWEPGFIECCSAFLDANPSVVAVLTAWEKIIDEETTILVPPIMQTECPSGPFVISNFFKFWAEQDHVQTGAIMIRKEVMDQAGGMREDLRISQDLEYWAYVATFGRWAFIPEVLYVNNSRINARGSWLKRYRKRRKLCPTVASWQRRIVDRLHREEKPYFEIGQGRVAAGFAYNKILGGDRSSARTIVQEYGNSMPVNPVTRLLKAGHGLGSPVWHGVCGLLAAREVYKDLKLRRKAMTVG